MSNREASKICFVHNKVRYYRIPLFEKLSNLYKIDFLIFQEDKNKLDVGRIEANINVKRGWNLLSQLLRGKYYLFIAPDIHFIETWMVFLVSRLKRKPFILWTETWDWPKSWKWKLADFWLYYIIRHSSAVLVSGKRSYNFVIDKGVDKDRIFFLPNACVLYFKGDPKKLFRKWGLDNASTKHKILYVGQLIPRKGVECLLKAISLLEKERDDFIVIIVGKGGGYEQRLRKLAERMGLETVKFLGWVDKDYLGHIYNFSELLVLPSVRDPFPLVVIEAMSVGIPVIVSDMVGEAGDLVIDGENGFVVPLGDHYSIFLSIKRLLSDSLLYERFSQECKETIAKRVTYEHMVDAICLAIEKSCA